MAARGGARARVERAERLVEQQHLGPAAIARAIATSCRSPPLSEATGAIVQRIHAEPVGRVVGVGGVAAPYCTFWRTAQMRKQVCVLIDDPEPPLLGRQHRHVVAAEDDPARGRARDAGDRLEQRRLARSGRPDHHAVPAVGDVERDVGQSKIAGARIDESERDHSVSSRRRPAVEPSGPAAPSAAHSSSARAARPAE